MRRLVRKKLFLMKGTCQEYVAHRLDYDRNTTLVTSFNENSIKKL